MIAPRLPVLSCYDSRMTFSLLGISIGNTRTQIGRFVAGSLDTRVVVSNDDEKALRTTLVEAFEPLIEDAEAVVLIASVDGATCEKVTSLVRKELQANPLRVEQDVNIPVGRQLDPEAIVGEDRLLNAAAAFHSLQQAVVVVDAGTAVTVDLVDGAGTFHGGSIAPGVAMQLKALSEHTDQLPDITMAKPEEAIGHNTVEAIRSGVFFGIRGLVRALVEQYAVELGAFPLVIATGGDAELLFQDDELVDRVIPDLTLQGLGVTAKKALEEA